MQSRWTLLGLVAALTMPSFGAAGAEFPAPSEEETRSAVAKLPPAAKFASDAEAERLLPGIYTRFTPNEQQTFLILVADRDRTYLQVHFDSYTKGIGSVDERGRWRADRGILLLDNADPLTWRNQTTRIRVPIRLGNRIGIYDPALRSRDLSDELPTIARTLDGFYTPEFIAGIRMVTPAAAIGPDSFHIAVTANGVALYGNVKDGSNPPPMRLLSGVSRLAVMDGDRRSARLTGPAYFSIGQTLLEAPEGLTVFADGNRIEAGEMHEVRPALDDDMQWEIGVHSPSRKTATGFGTLADQYGVDLAAAIEAMWGFGSFDPRNRINASLRDPAASRRTAMDAFAKLWPGPGASPADRFDVEKTETTGNIYGYPVRQFVARAPNGATCVIWSTTEARASEADGFLKRNPFLNLPFFDRIAGVPLAMKFDSPALEGISVRAQASPSWQRALPRRSP